MEKFIVMGGNRLTGEIAVNGAKMPFANYGS